MVEAQAALAEELGAVFSSRRLDEWLELCEDEDVAVGPVATLTEAAGEFGEPVTGRGPEARRAHGRLARRSSVSR